MARAPSLGAPMLWILCIIAGGLLLGGASYTLFATRREGQFMPFAIDLGPESIAGEFHVDTPEGARVFTRTVLFEKTERINAAHLSFADWGGRFSAEGGHPAGVFGRYETPLDELPFKCVQTGYDRQLGAGEPYDIIHLARQNYRPVREAVEQWRQRKGSTSTINFSDP